MNTQSQTRVNWYYTAKEVADGLKVTINDTETIGVAGPQYYINSTCDTNKEVDDKPLDYDPLDENIR